MTGRWYFRHYPDHRKEYQKSRDCIKSAKELYENDNAILQRYLDRMVLDEFETGGSEVSEQEENPREAVTQIDTNQNV
jgi:hypothetical protein